MKRFIHTETSQTIARTKSDLTYDDLYDAIQTGEVKAFIGDEFETTDCKRCVMETSYNLAKADESDKLYYYTLTIRNQSTRETFQDVYFCDAIEPYQADSHLSILKVQASATLPVD